MNATENVMDDFRLSLNRALLKLKGQLPCIATYRAGVESAMQSIGGLLAVFLASNSAERVKFLTTLIFDYQSKMNESLLSEGDRDKRRWELAILNQLFECQVLTTPSWEEDIRTLLDETALPILFGGVVGNPFASMESLAKQVFILTENAENPEKNATKFFLDYPYGVGAEGYQVYHAVLAFLTLAIFFDGALTEHLQEIANELERISDPNEKEAE